MICRILKFFAKRRLHCSHQEPRRLPMRVVPLAVLLAAMTSVGLGCQLTPSEPQPKPPSTSSQSREVTEPTPLGCSKENGRYFDYATKNCVTPTTMDQLHILSRYRYVHEIALRTGPIEYRINFRLLISPTTLRALLAELGPISITYFSLHFPRLHGGVTIGHVFIPPHSIDDVEMDLIIQKITAVSTASKVERAEYVKALRDGGATTYLIGILADPKKMPDWWTRHRDIVRLIQPILTDLDRVQRSIPPDEIGQ